MTHKLPYIMSGNKEPLRRKNWESFVRTTEIIGKKESKVSVLMLCYNHIEQFFSLLDHMDRDPQRDSFTITIVQNSDRQESLDAFEKRIIHYTDLTIIYPTHNLGSAGGYALGQEYLIDKGFSHLIMIEDDISLYEDDVISTMVAHATNDKNVVFIHGPVNAGGDHSWYVQCACYPLSLLEKAGIIDPRYYFRGEDLERKERLELSIKYYEYTRIIADRHYYHPYLKSINNSGSWIYFSLRNQFWTYTKHRAGIFSLIVRLGSYLSFALLFLLRTGKSIIGSCLWYAMKDGLGSYKDLSYQGTMIHKFQQYRGMQIADLGFDIQPGTRDDITHGVAGDHLLATKTFSAVDRKYLQEYPGDLLITGGFQPALGSIIACVKKVLIVEHLQWDKKIVQSKLLTQHTLSRGVNLLLFLPCTLLGCLIAVTYGIFLSLSAFFSRRA